ncbi:MAG: hypothetical protein ACKPBT_08540, partial [Microcystis aeruginosa]
DHSWERGLNEHTNIANGQKAIKNRLTVLENGQKNLELGQSEIKGDIRTLDGKIEDLSCKQIELKLWRTRRGKPPISPKKSEN